MPDSVEQILARMLAAYAGCSTYADVGTVETFFEEPLKPPTLPSSLVGEASDPSKIVTFTLYKIPRAAPDRTFTTRFRRGGGFRFDLEKNLSTGRKHKRILWTEGENARAWWSENPREVSESTLKMQLGVHVGASSGASCRIPQLLMPELRKGSWRIFSQHARVVQVAAAAKAGCIVVEDGDASDHVEQFWIDEATHAIRRVVGLPHATKPPSRELIEHVRTQDPLLAARLETMRTEQAQRSPIVRGRTTVYNPVFDSQFDDTELVFNAPST